MAAACGVVRSPVGHDLFTRTRRPVLDDISRHLRSDEPPQDVHVLLRGSPLTAAKLLEDAHECSRRYSFHGEPCQGISVELARSDAEAELLMAARRLSGRHHIGRLRVEDVVGAGIVLLPTFTSPHYILVLGKSPELMSAKLIALIAQDTVRNPNYPRRSEGAPE